MFVCCLQDSKISTLTKCAWFFIFYFFKFCERSSNCIFWFRDWSRVGVDCGVTKVRGESGVKKGTSERSERVPLLKLHFLPRIHNNLWLISVITFSCFQFFWHFCAIRCNRSLPMHTIVSNACFWLCQMHGSLLFHIK